MMGKTKSRENKQYTGRYFSPLGEILLAADDEGLTGLWFYRQEHFGETLALEQEEKKPC